MENNEVREAFARYKSNCDDAVVAGDKFYFTGKLCRKGHIAPRYVSDKNCYECRKYKNKMNASSVYYKQKSTEVYKNRKKRKDKIYKENNREKLRAQALLNYHVKCGNITRQPCEICGSTKLIHGHHDDYNKPLDVKWLCPKHHFDRHTELRAQGVVL